MAVQRGRSERRGESYSEPYAEPLSDTRTKLADFFNILLARLRQSAFSWQHSRTDYLNDFLPTARCW